MAAQFSFSFGGDDIEDDENAARPVAEPVARTAATAGAFPVAGKPLLPAIHHELKHLLSQLPSKIAYNILDVELTGGGVVQLPRRELWDVRVQLMAEDDASSEAQPGLGDHDVKTGVYEGGFKSWESSVDLVKVLDNSQSFLFSEDTEPCVVELGCGTALPSLALFQWAIDASRSNWLSLLLADYNPTVLQLVTLPNFVLSWALSRQNENLIVGEALATDGELELSHEVLQSFEDFLLQQRIHLKFFSGAWSLEFVDLVDNTLSESTGQRAKPNTLILGAETIYSPFALQSFTNTVFTIMERHKARGYQAETLVGAKKLYFGVGGSLDDFVAKAKELGADVVQIREETEGVRRGVVRCALPP